MAIQMTLFESGLYRKILPKECLSWNKKDKETKAVNIWFSIFLFLCPSLLLLTPSPLSDIVKQFNSVSSWVRTCMVKKVKKTERVELLKKYVRLMEELMELNNFNGMMEILSGLNRFLFLHIFSLLVSGLMNPPFFINSGAVRRLKKTFEELGQEYQERLENIELLLTHRRSYKTYRDHLSQVSPPCVPYMGVFLTALTFILDGNPDFLEVSGFFGVTFLFKTTFISLFTFFISSRAT